MNEIQQGLSSRRPKTGRAASLAVAAGIMLSRIFGLIRERVFAYYLGNSPAAGAFKAAIRIPNLLQNLFGEGVLSASFIPVYARLRAEGKDQEAVEVAAKVGSLLAVTVTLLAALGTLFAPVLLQVLAPGFEGDVRDLTVRIVQIMFPGVALLVLSAWCLGILNSHRRFFLSYAAPVIWNLAIMGSLLLFGSAHKAMPSEQMDLAECAAWGTVLGSFLQLVVQLPLTIQLATGMKPSLALRHGPTGQVLRSFGPILMSRGVVQLSAYVDAMIASFLGPEIVAAMGYAQNIYLLPISLFGMSISAAELPSMASVVGSAAEIEAKLREKLTRSLSRVAYFVIPSVVALGALGDVVVATIFQTGHFTRSDVNLVWMILAGAVIGLLATTQGRLCSTAFYALRDTRKPLRFATIRVVITALAGYAFALPLRKAFNLGPVFGAAGLTATAGVAGWIEFLLLRRALWARIGKFSVQPGVQPRLWTLALVSAAMARAVKSVLPELYPMLSGALILGVYGGAYMSISAVLGWGEGEAIGKKIKFRSKVPPKL